MPLVRFGLRNEYGLGAKELYKDGVEAEDPKAVLDGVAVAGLVGLLRQLGDLSQFAAEVFHGLQEQVASTASRSRKLATRVQSVEASLPSLEKAILSQTSHIHFAYTPGSEWHPRIRNEQNHFICDDLPHFIMDSYEECREPPRLQLLDRFDTRGPGSCLKRYSDPTFFKQASVSSEALDSNKSQREQKTRKIKKRKSWQRSGQFQNYGPIMNGSRRAQLSSQTGQGLSTPSHTGSTVDSAFRSDLQDQSDSIVSKEGQNFTEYELNPSKSVGPNTTQNREMFSTVDGNMAGSSRTIDHIEPAVVSATDNQSSPASEIAASRSSNVTWDEKLEIMEHMGLNSGIEDVQVASGSHSNIHGQVLKAVTMETMQKVNEVSEHGSTPNSNTTLQYPEATLNVGFMEPSGVEYSIEKDVKLADANGLQLGDISDPGSSPMSDADGHYSRKTMDRSVVVPLKLSYLKEQEQKPLNVESSDQVDLSESGSCAELSTNYRHSMTDINGGNLELVGLDFGNDEVEGLQEANSELLQHDMLQPNPETLSQDTDLMAGADAVKLISDGSFVGLPSESKCSTGKQYLVDTNHYAEWEIQQTDAECVGSSFPQMVDLPEGKTIPESTGNGNLVSDPSDSKLAISDVHYFLETNLDDGKLEAATHNAEYVANSDTFPAHNNVNAIEWHHHDDIDSETDNFVDALNTIDSESESESEGQTRKVALSTSRCELAAVAVSNLMAKGTIHLEQEREFDPRPSDRIDGVCDDSKQRTASVLPSISESLGHGQPSQNQSESAIGQVEKEPLYVRREQSVLSDLSRFPNVLEGTLFGGNADEPRLQPAACDAVPSQSEASLDDETSSTPHVSDSSRSPNALERQHFCANADELRLQPTAGDTVASFEASLDDQTSCTPHVSQEVPSGSTNSLTHAFWTNGTLFGLQPSKPPVCSAASPVSSVQVCSTAEIVSQCSPKSEGPSGPSFSSVKASHDSDNFASQSQDEGSINHTSTVSEKTSNKFLDHDKCNLGNHSNVNGLSNGHGPHGTVHKSTGPVSADSKEAVAEGTATSDDRSSILFLLGRGLKNGLRRSGSFGYDEKSKASNPSTTSDFETNPLPETNLNGKLHSPVSSPPPSPPLEHMKISFRPIAGLETSRLKLNYPEGIGYHEGTVDMFPSFQLVPESTKLQSDVASESDDDTFCRSYPCLSDDAVSISDSDSEQWESGDTSESNDHVYYEGLRRISSIESSCSSPEHDEKGQGSAGLSVSIPTSQSPNLRTGKQFAYGEMKACLNPEVDSSHLQGLMAQPPPLPPLVWCVSKPVQDAEQGEQQQGAGLNQSTDSKLLDSAISHPSSLGSVKLQSTMPESDITALQNKLDELKVSDPKQDNHEANGRTMDDRDDFLHQIRTKSFNLKRTETARPFYTPNPVASNQVTAILQKANAIRQAVGSDGEDDGWSDT